MSAINEIAQSTSDIRYKPGKELLMPDMLSRPFGVPIGKNYDITSDPDDDPEYVSPVATLAALEEVALRVVSPQALSDAQSSCPEVKAHKAGNQPKGVKMEEILIEGIPLYCEVSQKDNPCPLVPVELRTLVLNLLHHQDHPGPRETLRRVSKDYYWPCLRKNVESFAKSCHPCQLVKQAVTVNPGVGHFPVRTKDLVLFT